MKVLTKYAIIISVAKAAVLQVRVKGFTMLRKDEFLGHKFDIKPTIMSVEELNRYYMYVGWIIEPMNAQRFYVYVIDKSDSDCSKRIAYIPVSKY